MFLMIKGMMWYIGIIGYDVYLILKKEIKCIWFIEKLLEIIISIIYIIYVNIIWFIVIFKKRCYKLRWFYVLRV